MGAMGRPKDYTWTMPETWKAEVLARMKELKISKRAVARATGVTAGNITRLLTPVDRGGGRSSTVAPAIAEFVGVPLPGAPIGDDQQAAIAVIEEIRMLNPDAFARELAALIKTRNDLRRVVRRAGSRPRK